MFNKSIVIPRALLNKDDPDDTGNDGQAGAGDDCRCTFFRTTIFERLSYMNTTLIQSSYSSCFWFQERGRGYFSSPYFVDTAT